MTRVKNPYKVTPVPKAVQKDPEIPITIFKRDGPGIKTHEVRYDIASFNKHCNNGHLHI